MGKLNLTIDLNNLTEKEREKFFKLVEKSKEKKSFNPFERVEKKDKYFWIDCNSAIEDSYEYYGEEDNYCFDAHNYYNNKEFAEHQAQRELLNRRLVKFSYENGGADIIEPSEAFTIFVNDQGMCINENTYAHILSPIFISTTVAQRAIDEVVKPFMEEHPNFKWWG